MWTTAIWLVGGILVWATGWWLVALALRRNDLADVAWGLGFVTLAVVLALLGPLERGHLLLYGMVAVWGFRLSIHIHVRNRRKGEDFRYRKWREEWGGGAALRAFLQVFLLQTAILVVVAAPLLAAAADPGGPPLGVLALAGGLLWGVGLLFEAVGDWQLLRFKSDPENRGQIMTRGLWRYTRHPNYFGEVVLWWGLFLVVLPTAHGIWAIVSPVTMTILILFVSGIPMLEAKYEDDPEWEAYRRRTSAFLPMPPRSG